MQGRTFSWFWSGFVALLAVAMTCQAALAQDLKSFEQRITTKVLPNGLTLIVCERPEAPVFSYTTFIDAGDVNDPSGESGLAHMFEHLAFKGTSQIGTTDYAGGEGGAGQSGGGQRRLRGRVSEARGPRPEKAGGAEEGLRGRAGGGAEVRHPQPVHRGGGARTAPTI